jgi:hypothetical protein
MIDEIGRSTVPASLARHGRAHQLRRAVSRQIDSQLRATSGRLDVPDAGQPGQPPAAGTTRKLNPVIGRFAGRRHSHIAAQIRHVGRRSAKTYVTPVSARLLGDVALVLLTFGNQSDWVRNVRAVGGCARYGIDLSYWFSGRPLRCVYRDTNSRLIAASRLFSCA